MAGKVSIKGGSTSVTMPKPPEHTPFVLGSRPAVLRSPALSRITPAKGQRNYGKDAPPFSKLGSGNTGQSGMS